MTTHVPSLEWCKRLKACGFPQEAMYYHVKEQRKSLGDPHWRLMDADTAENWVGSPEVYASPIATELMEELPDWGENRSIYVFCDCGTYFVQYREWGFGKVIADFNDDYLCNALSAMYEYLAKGGLLK